MPDLKITQLTDLPIPAVGDELPIAADPLGTPVTKKTKVGNLTRQILDPTAKVANYTLTTSDRFITVDASGANRTIFVPAASGNTGIVWTVKKIDSSANTVTIDPSGSETIDGAADYVLTEENQAISFTSNGTNIVILFNKQEAGGGGGLITSVTDTAEINLTVTGGALSADIELDSIDETKLSPGVQDALTDGQAAFSRIPSGSFYMQTGADLTIPLVVSAPYAFTIDGLEELQTSAGTITAAIQINGTNVTGLSSLSVTTTPSNPTASGANAVSIGDRVTLVLSANSSAADLEFQLIGAW